MYPILGAYPPLGWVMQLMKGFYVDEILELYMTDRANIVELCANTLQKSIRL